MSKEEEKTKSVEPFIPHCEHHSWGDTIIVDTPSLFEITSHLLNNHYGKFKGMVHLHNSCKLE